VTDHASRVFLFGAGGHAKVVIDVLRAQGVEVEACLSPGAPAGEMLAGIPVLDETTGLERLLAAGHRTAFVAIGDNSVRMRVATRARARGVTLINAVSPSAIVAPDVTFGSGILIVHGAVINAATVIGDDAIVNTAASIDHDGSLGRGVHVAPGSHLAGNVTVGDGAFLGIGTIVIPGRFIGENAVVGAGSVVIRDIAAGKRAWGNPAREQNTGGGQPT
jgi:UDP-perosamine 4-acetyltransferase